MTVNRVLTTKRGDMLVDGTGKTRYLFEKDASKLGTAHGRVTYNGHLLSYFSGDSAAGDMNGVDIEGWYPVTPAGGSAEPK